MKKKNSIHFVEADATTLLDSGTRVMQYYSGEDGLHDTKPSSSGMRRKAQVSRATITPSFCRK